MGTPVVIVGAGQAGLSLSHELSGAGVEHVILERTKVAQSWRSRWDSFCLVTPNWTFLLPNGEYDGPEPDGFMPRDEIVSRFERYAGKIDAPVREGVDVASVSPADEGGLLLTTSDGDTHADTVVLAAGGYQKPHRPEGAASLPPDVHVIDAEAYTNPDAIPTGRVLVVGSGQTGCQIADELNRAGREVVLACGRAPWAPRRIEGRDIVSWVAETPFLDQTVADLPSPMARLVANVLVTGRDGGHDLNYRTLQEAGVELTGRFTGVGDHHATFADDLAESVAFGDARYADLTNLIQSTCAARGEKVPEMPPPPPFSASPPGKMDLNDCGAVIFTTGFRPDYTSWIHFPNAFDEIGFPIQQDGASLVVPDLYFLGGHFLRKRKSATLMGIAEDAAVVAAQIVDRAAS